MSITCAVGSSLLEDSYQAGVQAIEGAVERCRGNPNFVLAFSTEKVQQAAFLAGVRSVSGAVPLVGCCAGGIITPEAVETSGVAVMAVRSEELLVFPSLGQAISRDAYRAGEEAASAVSSVDIPSSHGAVFIMLPDGFASNLSDTVRGAYRVLGAGVKYVGGGTGDNLRFLDTYQLVNDEVHQDAVAGALVVSKAPAAIGIRHGWKPLSVPMVVTRAEGKVVYELDGRPAFDVYAEAAGVEGIAREDFASFAMTHPLGIPRWGGDYVIRDPLVVNEDRSISCVSEVPPNSLVRVMQGNEKWIMAAAEEAVKDALAQAAGRRIAGAVIFNCISRCLILGQERAHKELAMIRQAIGREVPLSGFLTFGEVGALRGGPPEFHNKTIVVWLLTSAPL